MLSVTLTFTCKYFTHRLYLFCLKFNLSDLFTEVYHNYILYACHCKWVLSYGFVHNWWLMSFYNNLFLSILIAFSLWSSKVIRLQRSGIDTIKYHTWPRIPMGKWQTHRRHHKREPRGQPFPSRWPKSTNKQTRTKHSKHKTEQKHKRSTKEVPPWNGQ